MAARPHITFVIAPGNHDPYTPGSVWARTPFPENVVIFDSPVPRRHPLPHLGVDLYGYAFPAPTLDAAPIADLRPEDPSRINLLCGHADLTSPLSPYAPTTPAALAATGMDYIALGHVHRGGEPVRCGEGYYAYPGCMEGRGFDEVGYKGVLYLEIEKKEGVLSLTSHPLRLSDRRYEVAEVELSGSLTAVEAVASAKKQLSEGRLLGGETTLRVILRGTVSPSIVRLSEAVSEVLSPLVYGLEVVDRTLPLLDGALLEKDGTLRGALYRRLLPQLTSEDEQLRITASRALVLGLDALAEQSGRGV